MHDRLTHIKRNLNICANRERFFSHTVEFRREVASNSRVHKYANLFSVMAYIHCCTSRLFKLMLNGQIAQSYFLVKMHLYS